MIGRYAAQADRTGVAGKNDVIVNQLIGTFAHDQPLHFFSTFFSAMRSYSLMIPVLSKRVFCHQIPLPVVPSMDS